MKRRGNGVLLHIKSLPSPYGVGDFGPSAYKFADFLVETGQSFWQILPLNPTSTAHQNSPYSSHSVFAGNRLLISPDFLVRDGLVSASEADNHPHFAPEISHYEEADQYKGGLLRIAYGNFKDKKETEPEFERFCRENATWLEDYALFVALKENFEGRVWSDWPKELKSRHEATMSDWKERLADRILMEKVFQYIFFKQWFDLKRYCNERNIQIIGDMPIYVNHDSPDVWAHPELFKLNEDGKATFVAGVPPDYFSATGQLWGNPVYNWDVLQRTGYSWWVDRIEQNFKLYNLVRFDHFRGLVAYWEVRAGEKTAMNGRWIEVPVRDFFDTLFKRFACLPIIAEDLGYITPDVREVISHYDFASMKVLLFAFGGELATNPYVPHNHVKNCVVYTGTHDNNTVKGWFVEESSLKDRERINGYLGRSVSDQDVHWEFIRMAMMSVADTAIIPMQDILGLGAEARMNRPSICDGNWTWRFRFEDLSREINEKLSAMTKMYARA